VKASHVRPLAPPAASPATLTDEELFAGIARGDLGPLGELFDRHHESVRAFALRLLRSPSDADDLVQETFLTASRAAGSFAPGASARPFLLGVAAQLVRRRRRSFQRLYAMLGAFAHAPPTSPPTPEDLTSRGEDRTRLQAAMEKLSLDHQTVLGLVEVSGLSGVEAASALGIPVGTVWRRLHEARTELRQRLSRGAP
jgi:RNA polymerase sigma-70 factor (ECF subfamily)